MQHGETLELLHENLRTVKALVFRNKMWNETYLNSTLTASEEIAFFLHRKVNFVFSFIVILGKRQTSKNVRHIEQSLRRKAELNFHKQRGASIPTQNDDANCIKIELYFWNFIFMFKEIFHYQIRGLAKLNFEVED